MKGTHTQMEFFTSTPNVVVVVIVLVIVIALIVGVVSYNSTVL